MRPEHPLEAGIEIGGYLDATFEQAEFDLSLPRGKPTETGDGPAVARDDDVVSVGRAD